MVLLAKNIWGRTVVELLPAVARCRPQITVGKMGPGGAGVEDGEVVDVGDGVGRGRRMHKRSCSSTGTQLPLP